MTDNKDRIEKSIHFTVLSLFPELVYNNVNTSITKRALDKNLFGFTSIDIRDYAENRYGKVDDTLYGGGTGMLMSCEPIYKAWQEAISLAKTRCVSLPKTIYLSPKGQVLDQKLVNELAREEELILLCGHYEGVDDRVLGAIDAMEVSIGDYVLTGGELAASVLIDAVARQQENVLPSKDAFEDESHYEGLLEARQYTKPDLWQGQAVPDVLLSGHHKNIARWRELDAYAETLLKREDLFEKLSLSEKDMEDLLLHLESRK